MGLFNKTTSSRSISSGPLSGRAADNGLSSRSKHTGSGNIPFPRDPDYIRRPSVLHDLEQKIRSRPRGYSWVALVGLAGTGKTQLAIEQGWRWIQEDSSARVFWIRGNSATNFQQDFVDIARILDLPGHKGPQKDVMKLVHNWLKSSTREWKIILDNADSCEALYDPSLTSYGSRSLTEYIPQVEHGSLLVTSRHREAASFIIGNHGYIVDVPGMNDEECIQLIRKTLPTPGSASNDERALIRCLRGLPLAIKLATSYIRHNHLMSIGSYLKDLEMFEKWPQRLIIQDIPSAVTSTLELSFHEIKMHHGDAQLLVSLMSCFDWQRVPESLLTASPGLFPNISFDAAMQPALDYCIVSVVHENERLYNMHHQVWTVARKWTVRNNLSEHLHETAINNLLSVFPWPKSDDDRVVCKELLPHCELLVTGDPTQSQSIQTGLVNWRSAVYLTEAGAFSQAPEYYRRAGTILGLLYGANHRDHLNCQMGLGSAYRDQGDYKSSRSTLEHVLRDTIRVLGPDDHLITGIKRLLATTCSLQGDQQGAIQLLTDVHESRKRIFGMNHVETARSGVSLSSFYTDLNAHKARSLEEESLRILQREYGSTHTETVKCRYNLAQTYMSLGAYDKALDHLHQVLAIRQRTRGGDHHETLNTQATLATLYGRTGKKMESLDLSMAAVERMNAVLGPTHPDTLRTRESVGLQLQSMEEPQRAESELETTYRHRRDVLGENHPDTLHTFANLALVYRSLGQTERAMSVAHRALESQKQVRPPAHSDILESMANIAGFYYQDRNYASAAELEEDIIRLREDNYGILHPDTIRSIANLSLTYYASGRREEAIRLHQRAFELAETLLGPEDQETMAYSERLREWIARSGSGGPHGGPSKSSAGRATAAYSGASSHAVPHAEMPIVGGPVRAPSAEVVSSNDRPSRRRFLRF